LLPLDDFLYEGNCPCNNSEYFWVQFHAALTEATRGILTYVTDGEKPGGAFRSDSFFSKHVIPHLNSLTVSHVVAIVVHREGVGKTVIVTILYSCVAMWLGVALQA